MTDLTAITRALALIVVPLACTACESQDGAPDKPWTWHALVLVLVGGLFNGVGADLHRRRLGGRLPALAFMSPMLQARLWGAVGIGLALTAILPVPPFSTIRPASGAELAESLAACALVAAALALWAYLTRRRSPPR